MNNDLLTTREAAEILGVSIPTVTRLAIDDPDSPSLPTAVKAPGMRGARMFEREVVEQLAAKRAAEAAA